MIEGGVCWRGGGRISCLLRGLGVSFLVAFVVLVVEVQIFVFVEGGLSGVLSSMGRGLVTGLS